VFVSFSSSICDAGLNCFVNGESAYVRPGWQALLTFAGIGVGVSAL